MCVGPTMQTGQTDHIEFHKSTKFNIDIRNKHCAGCCCCVEFGTNMQSNEPNEPNEPNVYPNTAQMNNMSDMTGTNDQMTDMTDMTDNNNNNNNQMMMPDQPDQPAKPAKSVSMVGVLAGVVVVAVIALIIVVVYFVAVRKCPTSPTNPPGLDCSLSSGDNISCTANPTNTACVCTYSGGTTTNCISCQPAAFDFDDPATYVSCTSSGCTGTLGPQGTGMDTWGTGKTCTNLGTDSAVRITLDGNALSSAVQSLAGTNTSDATWGTFSAWCSKQSNGCAGISITPYNGGEYTFTPCGKATSGASYTTDSSQPGYASNAFLYLPNSLPSTPSTNQQQQQQNMQPVKSKLPGWSA